MLHRLLAVSALLAATGALAAIAFRPPFSAAPPPRAPVEVVEPTPAPAETERKTSTDSETSPKRETATAQSRPHAKRRRAAPAIAWRSSTALGTPSNGRLVHGVRLPARGEHFLTWDPVYKRTPNRWWRRTGTDDLVRLLLRVARGFARAHPDAPRMLIGDLSRPHGGDFGRRFGPVGHASHQNGLDADVYFPRRDRRGRAPRSLAHVDRVLAQDLVDRFVRAGAEKIFVGAGLRLTGPPAVVQPWPNHDDHLHVRLRGV